MPRQLPDSPDLVVFRLANVLEEAQRLHQRTTELATEQRGLLDRLADLDFEGDDTITIVLSASYPPVVITLYRDPVGIHMRKAVATGPHALKWYTPPAPEHEPADCEVCGKVIEGQGVLCPECAADVLMQADSEPSSEEVAALVAELKASPNGRA